MSIDVGQLVVSLKADLTDLKEGLSKATDAVRSFGDKASGEAEGVAAAFGPIGLAVTAAATAVTAGMAMSVRATTEYGMELEHASRITGLTVESLARLKYAAEINQVSFGALTNSLGFLNKNMELAAQGSAQQELAFHHLGISVTDTNGVMRSTGDVFNNILDKFPQLGNQADKTRVAMELFGRGGRELIPVLSLGTEEIRRLSQVAESLGIVLNEKTVNEIINFDHATTALSAALKGVELEIGTALMPVLTDMLTEIVAMKFYLEDATKTTSDWWEVTKEATAAAMKSFSALLDPLGVIVPAIEKQVTATTKAGDEWTKAMAKAKAAVHGLETQHKTTTEKIGNQESELSKRIEDEYYLRTKKAQESFDRQASFSMQLKLRMEENTRSWSTIFVDTIDQIDNRLAAGFTNMIVNGQSFAESFKDIGKQILTFFIEEVIKQMIARWVAAMILMQGGNGAAAVAGGAQAAAAAGAAGAAAGGGAQIGPTMANGSFYSGGAAGVNLAGLGAIGALAYVHTQNNAANGEPAVTPQDLAFLPYTVTKDVLRTIGLGGIVTKFENGVKSVFSGGGSDPNWGGIDLASLRDERARMLAGEDVNSQVRGMGFQALAFYNMFMDAARSVGSSEEPTQDQINRNKDRFAGGVDWNTNLQQITQAVTSGQGAKLASGGMVLPKMGGFNAVLAEAGKSEAVIPLGDPKTKAALADTLGGGGDVHIHINGNFIQGNPSQWQQLIRNFIVPELRRHSASLPTGLFNRKRGMAGA